MLINPALGRLRQDRIFKTCGLVLSKCHRGAKKKRGQKTQYPAGRQRDTSRNKRGKHAAHRTLLPL